MRIVLAPRATQCPNSHPGIPGTQSVKEAIKDLETAQLDHCDYWVLGKIQERKTRSEVKEDPRTVGIKASK